MKDLKTHLLESIKPPRLSAKNKHLWKASDEDMLRWFEQNARHSGEAKIVDGKICVNGHVDMRRHIEKIEYPFGEVSGHFRCNLCPNLTSLENCPEIILGSFDCSECPKLISLEGAPKEVRLNFYCYDCGKKFTEADVKRMSRVGSFIYTAPPSWMI